MTLLRGLYLITLAIFLVSSSQLIYNAQANDHGEVHVAHQIHLLMPHPGSAGHRIPGVNCLSWRLAVEANNLQGWKTVPKECEGYVGHYMLGAQYRKDCVAVTRAAYDYVKTLKLKKDGKHIWIFDIDDTSLSNVPYHARPGIGFGAKPYNATSFNEWQVEAIAPAIPAVLNFYNRLVRLGVKIVFLSGTHETFREPKERNMRNIGYHTWEMMILKQANETGMKGVHYKSNHRRELERMGYRIIGNIGDQWSDLLGPHPGIRTFKLPDPMLYIS